MIREVIGRNIGANIPVLVDASSYRLRIWSYHLGTRYYCFGIRNFRLGICNHRLGIHDRHVGVDHQLGLKGGC